MTKPIKFQALLAVLGAALILSGCGRTVPSENYLEQLNAGRDAYRDSNWSAADERFMRARELANRAPITAETLGTSVTLKSVRIAAPALSQSVDVWIIVLGPEHPAVLTGLMQMAYMYYLSGNYKLGEQTIERALRSYKKSGKQLPETAETWLNFIPQLLASQGERERVTKLYSRLIEIHTEVLGAEAPNTVRCRIDQANWFGQCRKYKNAIAIVDQCIEIGRRKGFDAKVRAYAAKKRAWLTAQSGKFGEAEAFYKESIRILSGFAGSSEDEMKAEADLASFYEEYGGYTEAVSCRERLYKTLKATGRQPQNANSAGHELISVMQEKAPARALKIAEQLYDDYDKDNGPASPEAAHIMHHVAFCQATLGQDAAARTACNWGLAVLAWDSRGHVRSVINDLSRFADRLASIDNDKEALQILDEALTLARQSKEQENWGVQETLEALALKHKADWMRMHGETAATMQAYDEAITAMRKDKRQDDTSVALYLLYQTECALERQEYNSALRAGRRAEKIYIDWMGVDSARRARVLALLARAAVGSGNRPLSKQLEAQARMILVQAAADDPFDCCEAWDELGQLCLSTGRWTEARACFQTVIDTKKKDLVKGDIALARAFDGLGQLALRAGNKRDAMQQLQNSMDALNQVCYVTPQVVPIATHYIEACKLSGNSKQQAAGKQTGLKWCRELFGPQSAVTQKMLQLN